MSDRSTGLAPSKLTAVLGPTNTGKTHLAVERMCGHACGMIGLPLRLLAREIYDRIVAQKGRAAVALITGEEKIIPPRAAYLVCTVEAMPLERQVDFLAIDEIQLCSDASRGHIFTQRLLHARGRFETMFLGAATMAPLIRRLLPDCEIQSRDRFSVLSYAGSKKLSRLVPRTAIVAFSVDQVYAIAELVRRQRGGAAVVMGALSPRTRNAQAALFQSGEVDFLIATDAIGMGLNLDVHHVAFAALSKFDGRRTRFLTPPEVGQIAGRAGRFTRDGTFGVTAQSEDMDPDMIRAIEDHEFEPIDAINWRASRLDFNSLPGLLASLKTPPPHRALHLAPEALDEITLRQLAKDPDIQFATRDRAKLLKLWDTCQIPDFPKLSPEEHRCLVTRIFLALSSGRERLSQDWAAERLKALDSMQGEIEVLAGRLAGVRTLSYVANRPDWLESPQPWREATKDLETRLSDALHEKLTARFVDRRTGVLVRALRDVSALNAEVSARGGVRVEGERVGDLKGLEFTAEDGNYRSETKLLRSVARRAIAPEITKRLGALAACPDQDLQLRPDATLHWQGAAIAKLTTQTQPFIPSVHLYGDMGDDVLRTRARRRLETWLTLQGHKRLASLRRLSEAYEQGQITGLARGIAWRLIEGWGLVAQPSLAAELRQLSKTERRMLKSHGVTIGLQSVWLTALSNRRARAYLLALARAKTPGPIPRSDQLSSAPDFEISEAILGALGLRQLNDYLLPVLDLERVAHAKKVARGAPLNPAIFDQLGWSEAQGRAIEAAFTPGRSKSSKGRAKPAVIRARQSGQASPFAVLSELQPKPAPATKPKRRRNRRRAAKSADRSASARGSSR